MPTFHYIICHQNANYLDIIHILYDECDFLIILSNIMDISSGRQVNPDNEIRINNHLSVFLYGSNSCTHSDESAVMCADKLRQHPTMSSKVC